MSGPVEIYRNSMTHMDQAISRRRAITWFGLAPALLPAFRPNLLGQPVASGSWEEPTRLGLAAFEQGRLPEAAKYLKTALDSAKKPGMNPLITAACMDNLAALTDLKNGQRESLYRASLALKRDKLAADDPEIALSIARLVMAAYDPDTNLPTRPAELTDLLRQAMTIASKLPKHPALAEVSKAAGLVQHSGYLGARDPRQVRELILPHFVTMLNVRTALASQDPLAYAEALELNAVLQTELKNQDQQDALMAQALPIRQQRIASLSQAYFRGNDPDPVKPERNPLQPRTPDWLKENGTASPSLLRKREPAYSELARRMQLHGTTAFNMMVGEDGHGHSFRLSKGLGLGLDEQALFAIREWQFKPGTKQGKPVATYATLEVNFRLL
jgi:TonB family protein